MPLPAMSGAEPCVACAIARSGPADKSRRKPEPADESRCGIRQDVAERIRGDDHVELLRLHDELHRERIHQHFVVGDVGILLRELPAFLGEHAAGELEHRVLVDGREMLAGTLPRQLESRARHLARALARNHPHADRHVGRRTKLAVAHEHIAIGRHAFVVLPHDDRDRRRRRRAATPGSDLAGRMFAKRS